MKWKNKLCWLLGTAALFGLLVTPVSATSTRVTPSSGYMAHDYTFEDNHPGYKMYSGGLDIIYAEFAKLNDSDNPNNEDLLSRGIIHTSTYNDTGSNHLEIGLYLYTGELALDARVLFDMPDAAYPQDCKVIGGNRIWFSYTGSEGAGYYSIPWDPDNLGQYPVTVTTLEIPDIECNWEVEERNDGKVFYCGLAGDTWDPPPPDPHTVYYVDQSGASPSLVKILEVGGYSSGFAFDKDGNLWIGEYLLGWTPSMHVAPCRLGMWTKAKVDAVIAGGSFLTWDDAADTFNLGTRSADPSLNWGPNDIEPDSYGNIYLSVNTYSSWSNNSEFGAVRKLHAVYDDGTDTWSIVHDGYISDDDCGSNNLWDWHKTLSYDGNSNLDAGGYTNPELLPTVTGNRLFMDMDHDQGYPNKPDQFVVFTSNADADNDGVGDSTDNAPDTLNGGLNGNTANQQDTDWDMYGNACDADLDNSKGFIDANDYLLFSDAWDSSGQGLNADFDSNTFVDGTDYQNFKTRWDTAAPWY